MALRLKPVNLNLYKAPSNEILRHRKEFYGLWKSCDDQTTTWLNRIQSKCNRCEFPAVLSREYLLIDKFVCELDEDKRAFIHSVNTWTLTELMEYFEHRKVDTDAASTSISVDKRIDANQEALPIVSVKCEPLSNEFPDENIPIVEPGINDVVKEEQENDFVEIKPEPTAIIMDDPLISADSEHLDAQQIELNFEAINEITVDGIKSEFENYRRSDNYTSTTARIGKDIVKNHADCAPAVEPDQNKRKNQSTKKLSKAIQDVCDECNKTFLYAGSLERHKRAVHQRIRPYACKQCSKRFFQLNDLLRHNQVHNEVREMYTCDLCGKKFIQRSTLANHKMKIHQQIHLHECHLCAKRFQQIGQLKKHFVVHTGRSKHFSKKIDRNRRKNNVCNECDRSFVDSNCLLRHKRLIHQGIHPHACESCDKRFSEYTQLKIHMRTHTRKN